MEHRNGNKYTILVVGLVTVFLLLVLQLVNLQLIDNTYKINAENNALRYQTRYPVRGLILDRHGKVLVGNTNSYDIIVTPYDVKPFDTLALCQIFSLDPDEVKETFRYYRRYRTRIGYQSRVFLKNVSYSQYSLFIEKKYKFPGFSASPRSIRSYGYNAGGNLLGYVTEADPVFLKKHPEYSPGDYIGKTGLEEVCEATLKGEKGYDIYLRDANNRIQDHYENGEYDKPAIPGENVVSTIDAELQHYGEYLMKNKVGSIVAIEPSTGEILAMVSSPGIDVSLLSDIGANYKTISSDPFKPMYNRAVMSPQPPGSVFKLVNALIGLQEGVITESKEYGCRNGYHAGNLTVGCHTHPSPVDLRESIMMSCNAYYCNVLREILDNPKYENIEHSFTKWREYVQSFGFGTKLGSDFPSEKGGFVPSVETYNRFHGKGRWKSLSVISLSIGQGELGCTPLHLANLAATIANRGYYYIPHIIRDTDSLQIDPKYKERHYTMVDTSYFEPVIEGMHMAVNTRPGKGATATIAAVDSLEICGKTGTAQNPHGDDHSVFICFAPKENPKIAVAVYMENAGFGATWAAPTASLLVEQYLNGGVDPKRKWLEDRIADGFLLDKVPAWKTLQEKLENDDR
ncbi:MAG: penicillin-binding protein 2 [Bacteroidales bacterium]|nr:penicillin-binding protein 2 [Bacteroidales bacterium]MBR2298896.1 penicillin-binding protein 2 [Bacteroidales bacterium]